MKADNMIEKNGTICENLVTPVSDHAEVVVAGGGIAGIAAALAAARNGADVLLIEAEYALGGLATLGLITMYLPLCDGCGHQVSFGIAEELLRLSVKHGHEGVYPAAWLEGGSDEEKIKTRFRAYYNGPLFCIEAERLLLEAGVRILYGTRVCRAVTDGDRITALVVENKSGRYALTVKSVIAAISNNVIRYSLSFIFCTTLLTFIFLIIFITIFSFAEPSGSFNGSSPGTPKASLLLCYFIKNISHAKTAVNVCIIVFTAALVDNHITT